MVGLARDSTNRRRDIADFQGLTHDFKTVFDEGVFLAEATEIFQREPSRDLGGIAFLLVESSGGEPRRGAAHHRAPRLFVFLPDQPCRYVYKLLYPVDATVALLELCNYDSIRH